MNKIIILIAVVLSSVIYTPCLGQTLAEQNYPPRVTTVRVDSTNLPLVWITTTGQLSRTERIPGSMKVISNADGINYGDTVAHPGQHVEYDGPVQIRWRGNSSFGKDGSRSKKPMSVVIPKYAHSNKQQLRYEFLAPWQDLSYIRDILTNEMARGGYVFVPSAKYCEVFVDGIYYGVYILSERFPKGSATAPLWDYGEDGNGNPIEDTTGDFIVETDRSYNEWLNMVEPHYTSKHHPVYSDGTEIPQKTISYQYKDPDFDDYQRLMSDPSPLHNAIDAMEDAFASDNYGNLYENYIDVESFIDYEIAQELGNNIDGYRQSTPMWKYGETHAAALGDNAKWKLALWDFNLAYFHNPNDHMQPERADWRYNANDILVDSVLDKDALNPFYWQRLNADKSYTKKIKKRYTERRNMSYSQARIHAISDSLQSILEVCAVERDNQAWGNRFKNWGMEINKVLKFINSRLTWMDSYWYNKSENPSVIYFDNSDTRWEHVYVYSWLNDSTENAPWPGIELREMTLDNFAGSYYDATVRYPNVIFSDGTTDNQTAAFIAVNGHTYSTYTAAGTCGHVIDYPASKLNGSVLGYSPEDGHIPEYAFDGDASTSYSSTLATGGWVGLDLLQPHVIRRIGIQPASSSSQMLYGIVEGANNADFSDALPLWMFQQEPVSGEMSYYDINVTRAFRYVRYQGPYNSNSPVAELEIQGVRARGDDTRFYSPGGLPTVSVYVQDLREPIDKTTQLVSVISVISADGKTLVQDSGTVRLRGNWSTTFPKKPYRIKFDHKTKLLGSPAKAKKWTLIPSYGDKTLMRNQLAFDISERMGMEYTPFCTPVNVWMNGDFKGCYQLCDQIEVAKNRVPVEEMDTLSISGDSLTGGYLIEIDNYASTEKSWFRSTHRNPVAIKYPDDEDILPVQKAYITDHFNRMEADVYARNFDLAEGYHRWLDIASFAKRHLHQEFVGNTDNYFSVYMYKHRGDDRLYSCPVWDMDLAFENDDRTYPLNEKTDWLYKSGGSCTGDMKNFVNILLSDSTARHTMETDWAQLRYSKAIDESELLALVDSYADLLEASQTMNFWRWPMMNDTVHQNPVIWGSYAAEVENVRNYIRNRIGWMDNMLSCAYSTYELTISSAGWSTLYIPFEASIPEGLKVYTVTGLDGDKVEKQAALTIEPNKPYLVQGIPGIYEITGYGIPEWDYRSNGLLTGTHQNIKAPLGSYVLQKQNGRICFFKVAEGHQPTIAKNKAYLTLSSHRNAPYRYIEIDEESEVSALDTIEAESHSDGNIRICTPNGQSVFIGTGNDMQITEVLAKLPKGIYIIIKDGELLRKVIK